jgi:hypothetical protein
MFIGILLILLGILMLLTRLDMIPGGVWDYFWPVIVIALGGSIIFRQKRR